MGTKVKNQNFSDLLLKSVKEAHQHAKGKLTLKSEEINLPPEPPMYSKTKVKNVRTKLKLSQPVFAKILNVSPATVKAWELGTNPPKGTTARLLQMLENDPKAFFEILSGSIP
jgi:putative transcriptional regulator